MDRMPNNVTGASRASSILTFSLMNEPEAERLLAMVWCILEGCALTSPVVEVRSVSGFIEIGLIFESAADCALVEKNLPDLEEPDPLLAFDTVEHPASESVH